MKGEYSRLGTALLSIGAALAAYGVYVGPKEYGPVDEVVADGHVFTLHQNINDASSDFSRITVRDKIKTVRGAYDLIVHCDQPGSSERDLEKWSCSAISPHGFIVSATLEGRLEITPPENHGN